MQPSFGGQASNQYFLAVLNNFGYLGTNRIMTDRKGYIITDQYALYFLTFTVVGWVDLSPNETI
jgi:hypothetical protein